MMKIVVPLKKKKRKEYEQVDREPKRFKNKKEKADSIKLIYQNMKNFKFTKPDVPVHSKDLFGSTSQNVFSYKPCLRGFFSNY